VAAAIALPAWRAAGLSIAATLRQRGQEQEAGTGALPWIVRALVAALAAAVLALHLATGSTLAGIVASALLVIVAAIAARPLFTGLAGPLGRAMQHAGPTGRMALETLVRNPRRTALAISTIGVGLGTVVWVWTLARSFEQSVIDVMPGVLRGDLAIGSGNITAGYMEAPFTDAVLDELRRVPGVRAAAGEQAADWNYGGGPIALNAFDPAYFVDPVFGSWRLIGRQEPGALDATARGEAVIVSENFVRNLAVAVGDTITLATPTGALAVRIAGVTQDFLSPRGTIEMSRALYAAHWNDSQIVKALVRLQDGAVPETVREAIAHDLGRRYSLRILSLGALIDWFVSQVRRAFAALHVLAGLVLLVVLIGVGDALAASVLDRTRDIGVIRAVGVRRRRVGYVILTEAAILALFGLVIAWSAGLTLGILWVSRTFPALLGWTLSLRIPLAQLAEIGIVAVAVCVVAALGPARRAARLDPVDALRAE
jgi:putative ABC transport system permease protein